MNRKPLAYIDVLDGDQARSSLAVYPDEDGSARLRIGRSFDCALNLDDAHLAAEHAELHIHAEPQATLTLLPSLNGAWQGLHHLRAGATLNWAADGVIQIGHTRLRLRHAAAPLAEELAPLQTSRQGLSSGLQMLLLLLAVGGLSAFEFWLGAEPDTPWSAHLRPLLMLGAAVSIWAALWALLTQLFQRRFPFQLHLRRTLLVLLGVTVLDGLLSAGAYIASSPWLMVPATLLPGLALAGLVVWQGRIALPKRRKMLNALVLSALATWLVFAWNAQEQRQYRWRPPYLATLLPPQLRAAPLRPVDALLKDAAALREPLAAKAKRDPQGNEISEED
ncbi:FHA domain-containing protein [Inhella proteolytica]|uniref:FHA domain-containing protein n=1 Tax=Inhella proteolytica TaxID=2795029 RepID=A0A931J549_9BURK|nr:FHA domain-containing protein [Inhella proteolytica]MBH9578918.1 FHA domain-containing protein [Inhella proteolytica]